VNEELKYGRERIWTIYGTSQAFVWRTGKTHDNPVRIPDQESKLRPFKNDGRMLITTPRCSYDLNTTILFVV
jgi:hypothetical protein